MILVLVEVERNTKIAAAKMNRKKHKKLIPNAIFIKKTAKNAVFLCHIDRFCRV